MIFDIAALILVVVISFTMMRRGGVRAALSLGGLVLSLIVASILYPILTDIVYKTPLDENLEIIVRDTIVIEGDTDGLDSFDALPDFIKNVIDTTQNEIADQVTDVITSSVTRIIINVIIFVLLVIVTKLAIWLISGALGVIVKLPVLKQLNSLTGLVCGLAISFVVVYLAFVLTSSIAAGNPTVAGWIEDSRVCDAMSTATLFKV